MSDRMQADTSDAALIQQVRAGDPIALGALFDRHGEMVYRVCYRLLGRREDAEDAAQDVFGGLSVAVARYEEAGTFDAWLRRVAVRTALMKRRAESRRPAESMADRDAVGRAPDEALKITIGDSIASLPAALRDVVVLRLIEGYAHDEIARLLGISVSASKTRLHRAIHQLQVTLRGSL